MFGDTVRRLRFAINYFKIADTTEFGCLSTQKKSQMLEDIDMLIILII